MLQLSPEGESGQPVKLAFASASELLIPKFLDAFSGIDPEVELWVVSEFPPPQGRWIPYRFDRSFAQNLQLCRHALGGRPIHLAALVLEPRTPYRAMRLLCLRLAPLRTLFYNEHLDHHMLRPRALPGIARHGWWRAANFLRWQVHPGGFAYTWAWRFAHPRELRRPWLTWKARRAGERLEAAKRSLVRPPAPTANFAGETGISVVIPSRDGRALLERLLPLLAEQLAGEPHEIIVVDNGSSDQSESFVDSLGMKCMVSQEPLSFAAAVNRGIFAARYSHVCLLNNDMVPQEEFFAPLVRAFAAVPELFCATSQIFFPGGRRREETGKAYFRRFESDHFPIACQIPLPGEDLTYVLYGSGGCSLYDTAKLRALGGIGEIFAPAYVEDLDIGMRAWHCGWPSVLASGSRVTHDHRTTTSRYFSEEELDTVLECNYLQFLARSVASPEVFRQLWQTAITRLTRRAALKDGAALTALAAANELGAATVPGSGSDELILALGSGEVAVFPGSAVEGRATVLIASCYLPFPLSHGGAVRIYNLMRRAAGNYRQVLVSFVDELHSPPPELIEICAEIVQVRRLGSHLRPDRGRPDVVEDFDSRAFRAALQQTIRKWSPAIAQLEFTQMAQYLDACAPARTLLIEHDITIDLYTQLLQREEDWELRDQLSRWAKFEEQAWRAADCIVAMSEKDRRTVTGAKRCVALANGVDLDRYQPSLSEPDPARLLFIGSFAHLPNLLALDFFLDEVWPRLQHLSPVLHVIAGSRHRYHHERQRERIRFTLDHPNLELEGFVGDVRPAYCRATIVIAPLLASAGTNIKILEAMAMGKPIVSTSGGINGLSELTPGHDVLVQDEPELMAAEIEGLLGDPDRRRVLSQNARRTVEHLYSWDVMAQRQAELYESFRS